MYLLEKPMPYKEFKNCVDMLEGCENRICVSDDQLEIVRMVGFANDYISMLAQSRIMELRMKMDGGEKRE